jgi:hypothetical protein
MREGKLMGWRIVGLRLVVGFFALVIHGLKFLKRLDLHGTIKDIHEAWRLGRLIVESSLAVGFLHRSFIVWSFSRVLQRTIKYIHEVGVWDCSRFYCRVCGSKAF